MSEIAVMLVDDHPAFRIGIRALLQAEEDLRIVAEAANGLEALSVLESCNPDVALLDIQMPGPSGIDMIKRLLSMRPDLKVVMLTALADAETMFDAFSAGAYGYLSKNEAVECVAEVVRRVYNGEHVLDQSQTEAVVNGLAKLRNENQAMRIGLTDREVELLGNLANGLAYQEIAEAMFISVSTIKRMVDSIVGKLGVSNKVQAVAEAFRLGLI